MEREAFLKYPDFLQDFKEVVEMRQWQWLAVSFYQHEAKSMLERLKLETTNTMGKYWSEIVKLPDGINNTDATIALHQRFPVTTLEILSNYMNCWIEGKRFTLEFDFESMTFILKAEKRFYNEECYNRIRDVLPCNMMLVVEITE